MVRKTAPEMPDHTCPEIDASINELKRFAVLASDYIQDGDLEGLAGLPDSMLDEAETTLERVRKANHKLRTCAEYWSDRCQELLDEIQNLERTFDDMESQYQERISQLEDSLLS